MNHLKLVCLFVYLLAAIVSAHPTLADMPVGNNELAAVGPQLIPNVNSLAPGANGSANPAGVSSVSHAAPLPGSGGSESSEADAPPLSGVSKLTG